MNVYDYLIDHVSNDWARLLSGWESLLPPEFTVWLMNRYGDLVWSRHSGVKVASQRVMADRASPLPNAEPGETRSFAESNALEVGRECRKVV